MAKPGPEEWQLSNFDSHGGRHIPRVAPEDRLFTVADRQVVARSMGRVCARAAVEDATPHDLRRTCATWLGESGVRSEVIEGILNHSPQGVTKTYDRSRLLPQVAEAMQLWGDHVQSLMPTASV